MSGITMSPASGRRGRRRAWPAVIAALALGLGAVTLGDASAAPAEGGTSEPVRGNPGASPAAPPEEVTALGTPIAGGAASLEQDFLASTFNVDSTFIPPDTMGAVGPSHVVEMINGSFAIYNKTTGAVIERRTLDDFWTTRAGLPTFVGNRFDPRIVYDVDSSRFFAVVIDRAVGGVSNSLFVARSDTSDPTGAWQGVSYDADTVGVEEFHDYPTLAVDPLGVYICTNDFNGPGNESCYSMPKAGLVQSPPSVTNLTRFEATPAGLPVVSGSLQPVIEFGANDVRTAVIGSTGTALTRTNILGGGGAGATLGVPVAITGDPGHAVAPAARQPVDANNEIETVENVTPRFVGNVIELGDSIWAAHAVLGTGANSAVRWYEINELTNTVIQTGLINDVNRDFTNPTIAVNPDRDVVIGYSCSGPALAVSTCVSVGQDVAGATVFQAPDVLTTGAGIYFRDYNSGRNRWGDYSATMVDPSDPCTFWTFQEYVAVAGAGDIGPAVGEVESGSWGTRAQAIRMTDCGERFDFGDAPDTFGTTLAADGARHLELAGSPILGATWDSEADGQPSAALDGDDLGAPGDDEDGVTVNGAAIAGRTASLTVTVSTAAGFLDAFVDLNGNGVFTDPGEKVANSTAVSVGSNTLTFPLPIGSEGTRAARFRVSSAGGLGATGLAADGEVEDHRITIVSARAFCAGAPPAGAIVGTAGSDSITGTSGDDVIFALGGSNFVRAGSGNDIVCGGPHSDTFYGGEGMDLLVGLDGSGTLRGEGGNDQLYGGANADQLDGGTGSNYNDAGPGPDSCANPSTGPGC